MDEWRSDPTWRHEERLFTDGIPTPMVRDEGVETMDIEGAGMVPRPVAPAAATAPPVAPAAPVAPVDEDTRIRPERDRRGEPTSGFDDDAWTSLGAESSFDLHEAGGSVGASAPAAPRAAAAPAAAEGFASPGGYGSSAAYDAGAGYDAPAPPAGTPPGFIPGVPTYYEPPPLPPLDEIEDPDIATAVFPGASWIAPTGALRSLASLGPLPDPSAPVADPAAAAAAAAIAAVPGVSQNAVFADPDVAAERMGWRLVTPPASAGPTVFRQFLSLLAVVAVLGGVVYWQHRPKAGAPASPVPWAETWDPKVVGLARFVEKSRGLLFQHPVEVSFVPAGAFDADVRKENLADLQSGGAASSVNDPSIVLREALGLPGADRADVPASTTTPSTTASTATTDPTSSTTVPDPQAGAGASPVVGRYEPWTHRIVVRGADLTPEIRPVLVHELAHALQDQHFDLTALQGASVTNGSAASMTAAIEGDATAVERAYIASLGTASSAAPATDPGTAADPAVDPGVDLGAVTVDRPEDNLQVAEQVLDYDIAAGYVEVVAGRGGRPRRDELFTKPEASEASVLFPERQLLNVPLVDVAVPKLDDGDKAVKMHGAPHDVGPYLLSVALVRAQVPALTVFEFARAWAGDAYVPFRRDGAPCARIAIQSVQPADLTAVQNALTAFVGTRPTGSAAVATDDASGAVVLTTCGSVAGSAPPVATKIATGASLPSFFELVLLRSVVLGEPLGGSAKTVSFTDRRCLADEVIRFAAVRPWPSDGEGQRALGDEAGRHAARTCPGLSVAGANDPSTVASTAPAAAPADPVPDPAADLGTVPADPAAAPGG